MGWNNGVNYQQEDGWYRPKPSAGFGLSHVGDITNAASSQIYTFSAAAIGAPDPNRIVAVGISWIGTQTISSVTINGNAASHATGAAGVAGSGNTNTDIYYLAVPTGTTANIVVNLSATGALRCVINVYRLVGAGVAFSAASATFAAASATTFASPVSVSIPAGGGAIGIVSAHSSSAGPFSGTNLTLDTNNLVVGGSTYGCGNNTSGSGSTSFNASWAVATDAALSVATFSP